MIAAMHVRCKNLVFVYALKNPPVFDSANLPKSVTYMNGYLKSQGYYNAKLSDSVYIDSSKKRTATHNACDEHSAGQKNDN